MSGDPDRPRGFFAELKRRRVIRVAAVYAVVAWVVVEVGSVVFPALEMPSWTLRLVILLTLLGFPIALVLAWAFDVTPQGVKRADATPAEAADAAPAAARGRGAVVIFAIGVVVAALGFGLALDRFRGAAPASSPAAADVPPEDASAAARDAAGTAAPLPEQASIAVLPFADMSPAGDQEYFSDGLTEELLNGLAQLDGLRVAARTSSFSFKGRDVTVDSIGRALRVRHVLEGSVRKAGDRVRITAQLIDAESGYHVWSDQFDRRLTDLFAVQTDIARAIVRALEVRLAGGAPAPAAAGPESSTDPQTYDLYLRGRYWWNQRTAEGERRAARFFRRAIRADSAYAPAWAGLADVYNHWNRYEDARAAALRAVELDSALPDARSALAYVRTFYEWDWAAGLRELERALELNPNHLLARQRYAYALAALGRMEEAVAEIERAFRLDPLSFVNALDLGLIYTAARRYDAAIEHFSRAVDMRPDHDGARRWLGDAYLYNGMADEAIAEYEAIGDSLGLYRARGQRDAARDWVRRWDADPQEPTSDYSLSMMYASVGERERALELLERAFAKPPRERFRLLAFIGVWPAFDSLRSDPRFRALLERMGLAAARSS